MFPKNIHFLDPGQNLDLNLTLPHIHIIQAPSDEEHKPQPAQDSVSLPLLALQSVFRLLQSLLPPDQLLAELLPPRRRLLAPGQLRAPPPDGEGRGALDPPLCAGHGQVASTRRPATRRDQSQRQRQKSSGISNG